MEGKKGIKAKAWMTKNEIYEKERQQNDIITNLKRQLVVATLLVA